MRMTSLKDRICAVARRIPAGQVATYGDVAALAGAPQAAREVGWAMAGLAPDTDVPWWRIVNRYGMISPRPNGASEQEKRLRAEGVEFDGEGRIDLKRYRWEPPSEDTD
jgi:methylated-DNA-protein-cysteine methyltransferase-like protein